jgi:two-component system response regulator AtoC
LELADGGTLFLDEVGEMAPNIQVKVLRVLERMNFRRVGGTEDLQVSVRVISATNRDLAKAAEAGRFRGDLYFRLKVVPMLLPALRERPEDLPVLLEHFLQEFAKSFAKPFRRVGADAVKAATRYGWPGNIRELRNCMERAVLLHEGEVLSAEMLQIPGTGGPPGDAAGVLQEVRRIEERGIPDAGVPFEEIIASLEQYLIRKASEKAGWNQSQAARYLQLNRDKLRTRMRTHRFEPKRSQ